MSDNITRLAGLVGVRALNYGTMTVKMSIGFDGIIFGLQKVGGVSTYSWEIIRRLSNQTAHSFELELPKGIDSDRAAELESLDIDFHRYGNAMGLARYSACKLESLVVHSSYYRTPISRKSKSVTTVHDFVYERYRTGMAKSVHGFQKRAACRRADAILCVSENTRTDLLNTYSEVDPDNAFVIPLAVDHEQFHASENVQSDLQHTVVFIGQRSGYKRFDLAVNAVAAVSELNIGIVGSSLTEAEIQLLESNLKERWKELGHVTNDELREIYSSAFALIYPSDYEGFGLPLLEAQACGCPVVAANLSSLPEVGGSAANYAKHQSVEAYSYELEQLLESSNRIDTIYKGLTNAKRFHWDKTFDETMTVYEKLLQ